MSWTWYADVGNCTLHAAAWTAEGWSAAGRLAVDLVGTPAGNEQMLGWLHAAGLEPTDCAAAVLCISSPARREQMLSYVGQHLGCPVAIAREDFPVLVATNYYEPEQIGVDRLLNALAAREKVGAPCVVVDFGSCLTCDAVDAQGVLVGGAIAPGLPVVRAGLAQVVPHIAASLHLEVGAGLKDVGAGLALPNGPAGAASSAPTTAAQRGSLPLGRSTEEGLTLGLVASLAGSADWLIAQMRRALNAQAPVIATGGDAVVIALSCHTEMVVDEMLTLDGLRRAYEQAAGQI